MKIFYSPSYTIATYSFDTTRKSRWIAESLAREPITGIELVAPEPTSAAALSRSLPKTSGSMLLFSASLGFLWLGTIPLTSGLVGYMFGSTHMSMLWGIVFFSHQLGSFLGGWGAGLRHPRQL